MDGGRTLVLLDGVVDRLGDGLAALDEVGVGTVPTLTLSSS